MNDKQSWNNLGKEIRGAVEEALQTGDFRDFNQIITDKVTDAVDSVKEQVMRKNTEFRENTVEQGAETVRHYREKKQKTAAQKTDCARTSTVAVRPKVAQAALAPFRKIGSVSGVLYLVFGGVGTGVMAVFTAVFLGLFLTMGAKWAGAFVVFALLLLGFVLMINVGSRKRFRLRRAEKYRELSGIRHYINLEELALHTNKSPKFILRDVRKMLDQGFFPEGHLDRQGSCLMLDDRVYSEYLTLEKQRRIQEQEQLARKEEVREKPQETDTNQDSSRHVQLEAVIAEGEDYIRRMRELNDKIPGEAVSAKLFQLEKLLREIFESLKEHPEQLPQMQKFMNYYLPTTIKLVSAYEDFDSLSVQGEDIMEAKVEIEKTLDTINSAFGELLNRLFRDTVYDVTTDAQVLQTMLAQEGLTGGTEFADASKSG